MATAEQYLTDLLAAMPDSYQKTIGYPTYDILSAVALIAADLDAQLQNARSKLDPANLSGDELDRYIYQRRGIVRKVAAASTATLTVTGTGTISSGDLFETSGGIQYAADQGCEVDGTATITVTCTTAGASGNVGTGQISRMPITLSGIVTCTNPTPASGGADEETDSALLDRFYASLSNTVLSGNQSQYELWALDVSGVGYAKAYPLARGNNTVDLLILDSDGQPAEQDLMDKVQTYIDPDSAGDGSGNAPIGAHCYVCTADTLPINVTLTVSAADGAEREMIEASISENIGMYLSGEVLFKKSKVNYGKVYAYAIASDGVDDVEALTINGASASITIPDRSIAVLGNVVVNYA